MSNIKETIGQFFHKSDDNIFSQQTLRNTIYNFRSSGTRHSDFNALDEPGTFFFKPIFYFTGLESQIDDAPGGGLLYPSWTKEYMVNNAEEENLHITQDSFYEDAGLENSAYNYLMRNDEEDRAKLIKLFVETLSSICVKSPWYFQSVSGLDTAVEKKFYIEPKIDETRRQIKFELLPDAYDTRIGTMLDAYRSACFSWQSKREIVPANLRKFDMGLYIYLKPVQSKQGPLIPIGKYDKDINVASHKYLEFHNCEINTESFKFGDAFSNAEASGTQMKYTLTIDYDECFEDRINDQFVGVIGDCIAHDINASYDNWDDERDIVGSYLDHTNTPHGHEDRWLDSKFLNNTLQNVYSATVDKALDFVQAKLTSVALGNIYGFQAANTIRRVVDGQFFGLGKKNYKPDNNTPRGKMTGRYQPVDDSPDGKMTGKYQPANDSPDGSLNSGYRPITQQQQEKMLKGYEQTEKYRYRNLYYPDLKEKLNASRSIIRSL